MKTEGEGKMGNASLIHEIFQTSFELVIVTKHYINIEQGIISANFSKEG